MSLISRAQWKARPPKSTTARSMARKSTGHWNGPTVKVNGGTTWTHDKCPSLVRGIQNFHMNSRGWSDIAYNFVVCPHGDIYVGRGFNVQNGANGTNEGNRTSHAIMWLSGEDNPFTSGEKTGFKEAVRLVYQRSSAPNGAIGHRDHKSTACPGDARYNWIRSGMPLAASGPRVLQQGMTGDDVGFYQHMLNIVAGLTGSPVLEINEKNPGFGPKTQAATRDFQRYMHTMWDLGGRKGPQPVIDGKAGKQTMDALGFWIPIVLEGEKKKKQKQK